MAQAENKVIFSEEGLDRLELRLGEVEKKASGLLARLPKDLQREWHRAVEAVATSAKYALPNMVNTAVDAATAPAKSTFAQVLAEAHKFRKETSLVAVATGKNYDDVAGRIQNVSKRVAEMPATVSDWGRAAKRAGGDFGVAIDALEVMKDRAIQLDKPLSEVQESTLKLQQSFGQKNTQQMADFFGVMDAQAEKTQISVGRAERQFMSFIDAFGRMSSKGSPIFTGISAAFAASSSNPEQAQRNQGYGMGVLNSGARIVEQRMRAAHLLGRGQHITDEKTGEVNPERYLKAMQFIQRDIIKAHGGSRSRAIEIEAGDDLGARRDVAGFFNTDLSKVKSLSELSPAQRKALDKYMGMDAGKRDQSDVNKNVKDINAGMRQIGAQDAAVAVGGGEAGLLMNHAAATFSTAVDKFGGFAMNLLTSGGGGGAARSAVGAAGGAATGRAVAGKVAAGVLGTVGGVAGAGAVMVAGIAYTGWKASGEATEEEKYRNHPRNPDGSLAELGVIRTMDNPIDLGKAGAAMATALRSGTPLQVQVVPTLSAPPGTPVPP